VGSFLYKIPSFGYFVIATENRRSQSHWNIFLTDFIIGGQCSTLELKLLLLGHYWQMEMKPWQIICGSARLSCWSFFTWLAVWILGMWGKSKHTAVLPAFAF
jgi:hypothetical protein